MGKASSWFFWPVKCKATSSGLVLCCKSLRVFAFCLSFSAFAEAQVLFVSEYDTGNLRGFDYATGSPVSLPAGYSPVAGSSSGADGMSLGNDGRVFLSRTISGQGRIYSFTLNTPGDYASALDPASAVLIGSFGNSSATGIRIGPDNRLYANAFSAGEVWRSDVGITSMEASAFLTGLSQPGSIYFAAIPEPTAFVLIILGMAALFFGRNIRQAAKP